MNCTNCGNEMSHHYYSYYNHDANQCEIEIVECANCQIEEPTQLSALREAGEKMAQALRDMMADTGTWKNCEDAVTAWEAANK